MELPKYIKKYISSNNPLMIGHILEFQFISILSKPDILIRLTSQEGIILKTAMHSVVYSFESIPKINTNRILNYRFLDNFIHMERTFYSIQ